MSLLVTIDIMPYKHKRYCTNINIKLYWKKITRKQLFFRNILCTTFVKKKSDTWILLIVVTCGIRYRTRCFSIIAEKLFSFSCVDHSAHGNSNSSSTFRHMTVCVSICIRSGSNPELPSLWYCICHRVLWFTHYIRCVRNFLLNLLWSRCLFTRKS